MDRLATTPPPRELTSEECLHVSGGLIGPDQNLSDFPRILWPVIRVAMVNKVKAVNLQFLG